MLDKFGPRRVVLIGMGLIVGGFTLLAILAPYLNLLGAILLAMVTEAGNAFVMMPAVTTGANALPENLLADGTAVTTTMRQLLGSAGVVLATFSLQQWQSLTQNQALSFQLTFAILQ